MPPTALSNLINEELSRCGPMTMDRFMELALYHSEHGYYRRGADPFGVRGDFYTAEQLQPVFGELFATYTAKVSIPMNLSDGFEILEMGAGRADLGEALAQWKYRAHEWHSAELPEQFSGLVIANEFFDALPVHVLRRKDDTWSELCVQNVHGRFEFSPRVGLSPEFASYVRKYGARIPDGGLLEVNLRARRWLKRLSKVQRAGRIIIIDYGYSETELPRLSAGTLMSYRAHASSSDILDSPGERDITSHVNFSYLKDIAVGFGFEVESDQLMNAWLLSVWDEREFARRWQQANERWRLQWKQIFFGIGEIFRVLELRKTPQKEKAPERLGGDDDCSA